MLDVTNKVLLSLLSRNKYYNVEMQEIVECPICLTENHTMEDLLPFYLTGEQITCALEKNKVVNMSALAPGTTDLVAARLVLIAH